MNDRFMAVKRIGFAILSQGLMGVMSVVFGFILPKAMGPEQYGYYQEYAFYALYLNIVGLGINDGLALNYAGKSTESVPKERIRRALKVEGIYLLIPTTLLIIISIFNLNPNKGFVLLMLAISIIPTVLFCVENGLFLMNNNSITYNLVNVINRGLFCTAVVLLLIFKIHDYHYVILVAVLTGMLMAVLVLPKCKTFFCGEMESWKNGIDECKKLSQSGISIMLSVVLMGLIPTFGRIVVEHYETIVEYGVFSFYMGLLSIVLSFTNAIGTVAFPMMRNTSFDWLKNNYNKLEQLYAILACGALFSYVVVSMVVEVFMPNYSEGIGYFPILFTSCYPLGKIQMLIFPYLKTMRKEKEAFRINIIAMFVSLLTVGGMYYCFRSIYAIAIGTTVSCVVYYLLYQFFIYTMLRNRVANKDIIYSTIIDLVTPIVFVVLASVFNKVSFIFFYSVYLLVLIIMYIRNGRLGCNVD